MSVMDKKEMQRFFRRDIFAGYVGIELEDISPGRAKVRCEVKEHHLNGLGIVHGGMLFTLADMAFAAAANSLGRIAVALNASISYVKPAKGHFISASAAEISKSGNHAVYAITVTDDSGDTVAAFQGLAYVKKETWPIHEA
jgi:acyl-CoA thioesterase